MRIMGDRRRMIDAPPRAEKEATVPYDKIQELPDSVKNSLPEHAQEIYMKAFNSAWDDYADPEDRRGDASREEAAHRVAWGAVKQSYEKDEESGEWVEKD